MIFGGLALFLLSLAGTVGQEDYMNIYTHNMLLTLLRTSTGEGGRMCSEVSDLVTCSVVGLSCSSGVSCRVLSDSLVYGYMNTMQSIKPAYDWYLGVYDTNDYEVLSFGNNDIPNLKTKKYSATESVYYYLGTSETVYNVRLMLAKTD